jgi:hypothetical protein
MTINVTIRPGAALTDAETYRFVEEHILNAEYDFVLRHSYIPDRAYNKEGIVNILANYPWQEYGYKYGRWQRVLVVEELGGLIPWRSWEHERNSPLMLTDPRTGREIAEFQGMVMKAEQPAGTLLFAGDPAFAGVIRTTRDGQHTISIVGNTRLGHPGYDLEIAKKARDLTQIMVPGHPPAVRFLNPPQDYVKHLGPWLADHPDKPRKSRS